MDQQLVILLVVSITQGSPAGVPDKYPVNIFHEGGWIDAPVSAAHGERIDNIYIIRTPGLSNMFRVDILQETLQELTNGSSVWMEVL